MIESGIRNQESGISDNQTIKSFKDLNAWKESHQLVLAVYRLTDDFPMSEQFGLVNQLRRAAVSVTSNIAEGFSRRSYKDKAQFYTVALGSLTEIDNQMTIACDLAFISEANYADVAYRLVKANKILNGLIKKTREHS